MTNTDGPKAEMAALQEGLDRLLDYDLGILRPVDMPQSPAIFVVASVVVKDYRDGGVDTFVHLEGVERPLLWCFAGTVVPDVGEHVVLTVQDGDLKLLADGGHA